MWNNTRWKKITETARAARRGETRGKNERIAMNDVCMHFVTRIIVDLFSCGLPRPSLATEFKASIYKEWTNAMAAPTRRIGSECTHIRTQAHTHALLRYAHFRDIPYHINARMNYFISKWNATQELNVIYSGAFHEEIFTKKQNGKSDTISPRNFFEIETIVLHNVK